MVYMPHNQNEKFRPLSSLTCRNASFNMCF